jgi:mono/diheme cytochrome c family protein
MFRMMPLLLSLLMLLSEPRLGAAQQAATTPSFDVPQLFAGTCGWCHSDGGRAPGKGPQLMNTVRTDEFIRFRIQHGKEGAMPAFGASFTDADLDAIIRYIRSLKPEQG